jgi:hypothetical protein
MCGVCNYDCHTHVTNFDRFEMYVCSTNHRDEKVGSKVGAVARVGMTSKDICRCGAETVAKGIRVQDVGCAAVCAHDEWANDCGDQGFPSDQVGTPHFDGPTFWNKAA